MGDTERGMAEIGPEEQRPDDFEEEPLTLEEVQQRTHQLIDAIASGKKTPEQAKKRMDNLTLQAAGFDTLIEGFHNQRWFTQTLEEEVALAKRTGNIFTVIIADLDFFKAVNDTLGHDVGNIILQRIGSMIEKTTRKTDRRARIGGDEFGLILPETDGLHALLIADRILTFVPDLAPHSPQSNRTIDVGISLGVAQFRSEDTAVTLFKKADRALYQAKEGGRNSIGFSVINDPDFTHERMGKLFWNDPLIATKNKANFIENVVKNTILVHK